MINYVKQNIALEKKEEKIMYKHECKRKMRIFSLKGKQYQG